MSKNNTITSNEPSIVTNSSVNTNYAQRPTLDQTKSSFSNYSRKSSNRSPPVAVETFPNQNKTNIPNGSKTQSSILPKKLSTHLLAHKKNLSEDDKQTKGLKLKASPTKGIHPSQHHNFKNISELSDNFEKRIIVSRAVSGSRERAATACVRSHSVPSKLVSKGSNFYQSTIQSKNPINTKFVVDNSNCSSLLSPRENTSNSTTTHGPYTNTFSHTSNISRSSGKQEWSMPVSEDIIFEATRKDEERKSSNICVGSNETTQNIQLPQSEPNTDLIDVDLIRGSTFSKAKTKFSIYEVIVKAVGYYVFLPFYYEWWISQINVVGFNYVLYLYVSMLFNWWFCFYRAEKIGFIFEVGIF